jgi:phosphatidylglycerol:prolipoprotein diacylglycerol transferase
MRIYSYPFMLYVGILFGLLAGTRWADLHRLNTARVYAAMLLLVLPALVGARLLFIVSHWELYRHQPRRIWQRSDGGAALYGGLVAAFLLSLPLLKAFAIPVGLFWDAATVTMLVGMIFTKVGCMLNGCCAGLPTERRSGLCLPNIRGVWCRRVPTQFLEAGLAAILLFVATAFGNRLPFDGALFLSCLAGYAIGRWMLELTRESIDKVAGLSLHRMISAALATLSLASLVVLSLHRS